MTIAKFGDIKYVIIGIILNNAFYNDIIYWVFT